MEFDYSLSTSEYGFYKMVVFEAHAEIEGIDRLVRMMRSDGGDWGDPNTTEEIGSGPFQFPKLFKLSWYSPSEEKYYYLDLEIDREKAEELWMAQEKKERLGEHFRHIVVGMAPYGIVAVWLRSDLKAVLLHNLKAHELPLRERMRADFRQLYPNRVPLMPRHLFEGWMHQYTYRYVPLEEYWDGKQWQPYKDDDKYYDDIDVLSIFERRKDGTFDFTGDYQQLNYHEAGRAEHFSVKWTEGTRVFESHYWMNEQVLGKKLDSIVNQYPEAKIDFLIRIDSRANRYELALGCKEMSQPLVIPQETYQQLIFRDNHEFYKSENYDMPDGAWNW